MSDAESSARPPHHEGSAVPAEGSSRPTPGAPVLVTGSALVTAALIALTGQAEVWLLAAAVALAGAVLAWGWAGLLALPSPRGTGTVLLLGTAALVLTTALTTTEPYLRWAPAAMAGGVLACFVHQLARRDGRPRLVESVGSTLTGLAVVASGACLIPLPRVEHGPILLAAGLVAVAIAAVVDLAGRIRGLRPFTLPVAMLLGVVAAVLIGQRENLSWVGLAVLGVAAAAVGHALRQVLAVLPAAAGARAQLVSGAASVLCCGVVVAAVQRIFFA